MRGTSLYLERLPFSRRKQLLQDPNIYPEFYKPGQKPSQPAKASVIVSKRALI